MKIIPDWSGIRQKENGSVEGELLELSSLRGRGASGLW